MGRELKPHGTVAAYMRHLRAGEEPCRPCKDARAAYARSRYVPSSRVLEPCGTFGGYLQHLRAGQETCRECRDAAEERRRAAAPPGTHGTNGGYVGHLKSGERPCQACSDAHREYSRAWRAKRARSAALDAAWAEVLTESGVA